MKSQKTQINLNKSNYEDNTQILEELSNLQKECDRKHHLPKQHQHKILKQKNDFETQILSLKSAVDEEQRRF